MLHRCGGKHCPQCWEWMLYEHRAAGWWEWGGNVADNVGGSGSQGERAWEAAWQCHLGKVLPQGPIPDVGHVPSQPGTGGVVEDSMRFNRFGAIFIAGVGKIRETRQIKKSDSTWCHSIYSCFHFSVESKIQKVTPRRQLGKDPRFS